LKGKSMAIALNLKANWRGLNNIVHSNTKS